MIPTPTVRRDGRRPTCCRILASSLLLALFGHFADSADAADWETEADLSTALRYNDNPGFLADGQDPEGALACVSSAQAGFAYRTANSETLIQPKIQRIYYFDEDFSELNQTDYLFSASTNTLRRRFTWGVDFSYADRGILTAEDVDPDDPTQGGDANFLAANDRVETLVVAPSINWQLTPRDRVSVTLNYQDSDFDRDFTLRSDFENYGGSITYDRQLTQRQSLGFLASRTNLDSTRLVRVPVCDNGELPVLLPIGLPDCPPDNILVFPTQLAVADFVNDSKGTSLRLVYNFNFSEQLQLSAQIGRQNTDIVSGLVLPVDDQLTQDQFRSTEYNVRLTNAGQRSNLLVNLSRIVQPTSFGQPADTVRLSTSFTYRLTRLMTLELTGVAFQQDLRSAAIVQQNEFYRGDLAIRWRLARNWSVISTYTYRYQKQDLTRFEGSALPVRSLLDRRGNSGSLALRYRFR